MFRSKKIIQKSQIYWLDFADINMTLEILAISRNQFFASEYRQTFSTHCFSEQVCTNSIVGWQKSLIHMLLHSKIYLFKRKGVFYMKKYIHIFTGHNWIRLT